MRNEGRRDLIVVGAGAAGLVAAYTAAQVGARVMLVERDRMGGDCLNTGCVPSKALLHAAKLAHGARTGARVGVDVGDVRVDFARVMAHVRGAIDAIAPNDSVERYTALGVEVARGEARLLDRRTVAVDGTAIATRGIILATGAEPVVPKLPGLDAVRWATSDTLWQQAELPRRLVVLGGGPIGCELAQAFARLGSAVTVVEMMERLLPREEAAAGAAIVSAFDDEGIAVRVGRRALRCETSDEGQALVLAGPEGVEERVPFDLLLLALGRRARRGDLGLESVGVALDPRGFVKVDDLLRTSVPGIYACGDATGGLQFTHVAGEQGWCAATNALYRPFARLRWASGPVPRVTYTDPEIATLGPADGAAVVGTTIEVELRHLDRAVADGEHRGFARIVHDGRGRILAATVVAPRAGELIAELALAMRNGLGLGAVLRTIHAYPSYSEINRRVASSWRDRTLPAFAKPLARKVLRLLNGAA